jgi:hypothetical protein
MGALTAVLGRKVVVAAVVLGWRLRQGMVPAVGCPH